MARPLKPASDHPSSHPWWQHVPEERRPALINAVRHKRLKAFLALRRSRIIILVAFYVLLCSLPVLLGGASLAMLAILPLLLLPALAGLAWWLTWKEFHH